MLPHTLTLFLTLLVLAAPAGAGKTPPSLAQVAREGTPKQQRMFRDVYCPHYGQLAFEIAQGRDLGVLPSQTLALLHKVEPDSSQREETHALVLKIFDEWFRSPAEFQRLVEVDCFKRFQRYGVR